MTITNAAFSHVRADARHLRQLLLDARARSLALIADLTGAQLLGPRLEIVNPPLWEIGHLGWFQERWCLRHRAGGQLRASMLAHADRLYDSSAVPHGTRWDLPLPELDATLGYAGAVLERVLERLDHPYDDDLAYFAELAALHEEMHCEAFTYTRQTLGYSSPQFGHRVNTEALAGALTGDVEIAGGEFMLGAAPDNRFVFDNEKWAHPITVAPFEISRAAVSNSEFAAFVDAGGYGRRELWCAAGWQWRVAEAAMHPMYWRRHDGAWWERRYTQWVPLAPHAAVLHVSWYEANAFCRWVGRRLPSEPEWEYAAATDGTGSAAKRRYPWGDAVPTRRHANLFGVADGPVDVAAFPDGDSATGCRQMIGNVWEWTADAFGPYPEFVADPYEDYSQPWFGDHKVLRGGCFATRASLIRNTWRNFYMPDRRDPFVGFRTCA